MIQIGCEDSAWPGAAPPSVMQSDLLGHASKWNCNREKLSNNDANAEA
jgi:hypothetical protein